MILSLPIFRSFYSLALEIYFGSRNPVFSILTTWSNHTILLVLLSDIILIYIFEFQIGSNSPDSVFTFRDWLLCRLITNVIVILTGDGKIILPVKTERRVFIC